jgi:hypothetical protein
LAAGYKFPARFTVKAADGITDLYGIMYKPFDFDPERKYPIITYVYPGPQVEGPGQAWSQRMDRLDRLAQMGFIVITVGNRGGHPNRSKWYHNFGYGNLRDYGLEDQKYAIEQLASRHSFIDVSGWGSTDIQAEASCLRQPFCNTPNSLKWPFPAPGTTKTTFTTVGGVKNTTGFGRNYRKRRHNLHLQH